MRHYIEFAQLIAAGFAAGSFLAATLSRVHYDLDRIVDGMKRVARWNAAASLAGTAVFACQVALYFFPASP